MVPFSFEVDIVLIGHSGLIIGLLTLIPFPAPFVGSVPGGGKLKLTTTNDDTLFLAVTYAKKVLSPTTNKYDYVNYVPNTQSNKFKSITLLLGLQELSGGMRLPIPIVLGIKIDLFGKSVFEPNSDVGVQAAQQGLFLFKTKTRSMILNALTER